MDTEPTNSGGVQLPDNRMRFPAATIDFSDIVGLTGQAHDTYPSAGQQPRYDWMRMVVIALLANQSSFQEPTQYRDGSWWFDLNTLTMKIMINNQWVPVANALQVDTDQYGNPITLAGVYATIKTMLGNSPSISFGGKCFNQNVQLIPIPAQFLAALSTNSRPFLWIDGLLIDPRLVQLSGGPVSTIALTGSAALQPGNTFTVLIVNIENSLFGVQDVIV